MGGGEVIEEGLAAGEGEREIMWGVAWLWGRGIVFVVCLVF